MTDIQPTIRAFDSAATRAFEALVEYFDGLHQVRLGTSSNVECHVFARANRRTARSARKAWNLGVMLLARVAGDESAPEDHVLAHEADAMLEALDSDIRPLNNEADVNHLLFEMMRDARPDLIPATAESLWSVPVKRDDNLKSVGALLSEIALEERGIDATLNAAPNGAPVILVMPMDPAMALWRSFRPLFDILQMEAECRDLVSIERQASGWWFDSWSTPARDEVETVARNQREMEFTFFDRPMVWLGETLAAAAARNLPAGALTPRQRMLLDGVAHGVCGFFLVRQRRGPIAVLEAIDTGAEYLMREHDVEQPCEEGSVVAGRLIPIPEIGWIRSPGSILCDTPCANHSAIAKELREAGSRRRAIVVETLISRMRGQEVAGQLAPAAESRKDARALLLHFDGSLADAGLRCALPLGDTPPRVHPEQREVRADTAMVVLDDPVLGAWTRALVEESGLSPRRWRPHRDADRSGSETGARVIDW